MMEGLESVLHALPVLVPALLGLVLAAMFLRSARVPAMLVLAASVSLLLHGGYLLVDRSLLTGMVVDGNLSIALYEWLAIGIYGLTILAAFCLLLGAVFVGRPVLAAARREAVVERPTSSERGNRVLALGLLGILFPPLGTVAALLGWRHMRAMRAGRMDANGGGKTMAGVILGLVMTVVMVFALLVFMLFWYAFSTADWGL